MPPKTIVSHKKLTDPENGDILLKKGGDAMDRKYRVCNIILAICACFCMIVTVLGSFFAIADGVCEQRAHIVPSYAKADLTPLIEKEVWTDEDYAEIYRQTGLGRAGADSVPREELPLFQEAFFLEGEHYHDYVTPITPHDKVRDPATGTVAVAPIVPLEDGDILVTSSTHLFGWRHGHAALVVDGKTGTVLESVAIGVDSKTTRSGARWFCASSNFMVLRLKGADKETRASIAANAINTLTGLSYNVFVGFFLPKDQCKDGRTPTSTHCAHLVWQSFLNAGYDLDPTGGPLVSPKDIARSPLLEVVQVYGFDAEKLWE